MASKRRNMFYENKKQETTESDAKAFQSFNWTIVSVGGRREDAVHEERIHADCSSGAIKVVVLPPVIADDYVPPPKHGGKKYSQTLVVYIRKHGATMDYEEWWERMPRVDRAAGREGRFAVNRKRAIADGATDPRVHSFHPRSLLQPLPNFRGHVAFEDVRGVCHEWAFVKLAYGINLLGRVADYNVNRIGRRARVRASPHAASVSDIKWDWNNSRLIGDKPIGLVE
ncbi:hypothetical protein AAG570_002894 [Ranatra chinensis]|uniref:Uncharacterized protein n=1 Tax=Ranatra chinensis TaxID=642074 RepID=A0ABD0YTN7_9HEMI